LTAAPIENSLSLWRLIAHGRLDIGRPTLSKNKRCAASDGRCALLIFRQTLRLSLFRKVWAKGE
jgi:hypothetical protein